MTSGVKTGRKERSRPVAAGAAGILAGVARLDERWWIAHARIVLFAVAAIAILVRAVYFVQLAPTPCALMHRASETDMAYFNAWGRAIAAGDRLSARVEPPYHGWHRTLAQMYFRDYPAAARSLEPLAARAGVEPGVLLWRQWAGGGRFYQEPLYPYLIAATYSVLSRDPRWVIAWQLALGVASTLLVLFLTRRLFGHRAAVIAAAIACLGGPWIYLEAVLVRTSILTFAGLGLVWLLDAVLRRSAAAGEADAHGTQARHPAMVFLTGVAFGVAAMLQSTFLAFAVGAMILAVLAGRRSSRSFAAAALLAAGTFAGISPLIVRNIAVGAPPLAFAAGGAMNFIVSNAYEPGADVAAFRGTHVARIMASTHGAFIPTVLMTLGTYHSPLPYLLSLARKFAAVWHWFEAPDNTDFYYFRLHAGVLRLLFVNFTVVGSLAAIGLLRAARREATRRAPLYLLAAMNLALLLAFMVVDRFRAPLAFSLMPFAGFALVEIADALRARRFRTGLALAAAAIVVAALIARPLPAGTQKIRVTDYSMAYEVDYEPKVRAAGESRGDWELAASILKESLRFEPRWLASLGPSLPARSAAEADIAGLFAEVRNEYAQTLELAREGPAAETQRRRAAELRAAAAAGR